MKANPARAAVILALLLGAGGAEAQVFGKLYGVAVDENGAELPGVTISLQGMGAPRVTVTDARGGFRFPSLDPGAYSLEAKLDGYSTVEQPAVIVNLSRATTVNVTLNSAVEDSITVTSESPLLDEKRFVEGTVVDQLQLETVPHPRDLWALLTQAPGVLTDRVNVGGSETGHQAVFMAPGMSQADNDYLMDGVQVTDSAVLGTAPLEPGIEQFEAIEISTGGADVTKNTAGVAVNMVSRRGTNEFRGGARFLAARGDGLGFLNQSSSNFDCSDLAANQSCEGYVAPSINRIDEYGFESGGPAIVDRLWLWGHYSVREIDVQNIGGGPYKQGYEDVGVKLNTQLGARNSAVASWSNNDKTLDGRGGGPGRALETTWDQRGPTAIWRFEDTHVFDSSLYLSGSYSIVDAGFKLTSKATGAAGSNEGAAEARWASDGVWRDNFLGGYAKRSHDQITLDGSYFFSTGGAGHELKFGGRLREVQSSSLFAWPGRGIAHMAGENFGNTGTPDFFFVNRPPGDQVVSNDYASLWVQDTIAAGNWTINAGLRYDFQDGTVGGTTTGTTPPEFQDLLPTLSAPSQDGGFDWSTVTPRIGVTRALGDSRDTLLRASFSMFPQVLGANDLLYLSGVPIYSYAYYAFLDQNDNDKWDDAGEPYFLIFTDGFNPDDQLAVVDVVDSGLDPEMTTEVVLGVEHSFAPELVVGANYTYRLIDDVRDEVDLITGPGIVDPKGRPWAAADFVSDGVVSRDLPTVIADGSTRSVETFTLAPGLGRTGGVYVRNGTRSREYNGLTITLNKRLANQWAMRGYINWGETEWGVPDSYLANSDPNDALDGSDNDGAVYFIESSISGKGSLYLQSGWQANLTGLYQFAPDRPWGFSVSGNIYAREGYPVPYGERTIGSTDGVNRVHSLLGRRVDQFRVDDLLTVDLRAEKTFAATHNVNLNLFVELFNALNDASTLAREPVLTGGTADWVQDVVAPRIWKLGVRISWR